MKRYRLAAVFAAAALACCTGGGRADAAPHEGNPGLAEQATHRCAGDADVHVRAADADDALAACEGVRRALAFLARADVEPPPSTTIEIVAALPDELCARAVGCYRRRTRDILLLSYAAFEAGGRWFQMPADRELYRSAAAHEMAHAVVARQAPADGLAVAAHEYVAYVVLFATMEPGLRERLLARFPGAGFSSTLQINEVNHLANPNQFAVDAWRHYLRRRDRAAWLREMIAGRVVEDLPRDGP